jgi:hypothetical protein
MSLSHDSDGIDRAEQGSARARCHGATVTGTDCRRAGSDSDCRQIQVTLRLLGDATDISHDAGWRGFKMGLSATPTGNTGPVPTAHCGRGATSGPVPWVTGSARQLGYPEIRVLAPIFIFKHGTHRFVPTDEIKFVFAEGTVGFFLGGADRSILFVQSKNSSPSLPVSIHCKKSKAQFKFYLRPAIFRARGLFCC